MALIPSCGCSHFPSKPEEMLMGSPGKAHQLRPLLTPDQVPQAQRWYFLSPDPLFPVPVTSHEVQTQAATAPSTAGPNYGIHAWSPGARDISQPVKQLVCEGGGIGAKARLWAVFSLGRCFRNCSGQGGLFLWAGGPCSILLLLLFFLNGMRCKFQDTERPRDQKSFTLLLFSLSN